MARYDAGWEHPSGRGWYDQPYRPYGPPSPVARPGGSGRAGFRGVALSYDPDFTGWGRGVHEAAPWGEDAEEQWDDGSIYGPARYGLGPYYERLRRRRRPDEELQEEVEEALFFDTWVDADAITVEVEDGIVTLRGELPDYDEIRYATDDVWDVDGVRGVHSELTVRGEAPRPREAEAPAAGGGKAATSATGGAGKGKGATGKRRGRKKAQASGS
jgi:hypothetical protein